MGMGIALFSHRATLSWGFSADWDLVPDLLRLVEYTARSFEELRAAAAQAGASSARPSASSTA
jgi:hypothetical protein